VLFSLDNFENFSGAYASPVRSRPGLGVCTNFELYLQTLKIVQPLKSGVTNHMTLLCTKKGVVKPCPKQEILGDCVSSTNHFLTFYKCLYYLLPSNVNMKQL